MSERTTSGNNDEETKRFRAPNGEYIPGIAFMFVPASHEELYGGDHVHTEPETQPDEPLLPEAS